MNKMNSIGLDAGKTAKRIDLLNDLLSNYSVFYQNARGFHWNIQGDKFFELHLKFEELYNNLLVKIDEVAERILTLGGAPEHNYSKYLRTSAIKESDKVTDGMKALKLIVDSFSILIAKQRILLKLSADANDEGSNALMSDYIREEEKLMWMYSAYLKK